MPHSLGDFGAAGLGFAWMLQDEGTLHEAWTVQSGGQSEVTLEQGTHPPEPLEHGINSDGRHFPASIPFAPLEHPAAAVRHTRGAELDSRGPGPVPGDPAFPAGPQAKPALPHSVKVENQPPVEFGEMRTMVNRISGVATILAV